MQTFMPVPDFLASAEMLDRQRLGKQRVEGIQILDAVLFNKGWIHHPATKMWLGKPGALCRYIEEMCLEWRARGHDDTVYETVHTAVFANVLDIKETEPWWVGDEAFHLSHRSNLLRKYPEHYRAFWPNDPDDLEYIWPSAIEGEWHISKPGLKRIAAGVLRDPREAV